MKAINHLFFGYATLGNSQVFSNFLKRITLFAVVTLFILFAGIKANAQIWQDVGPSDLLYTTQGVSQGYCYTTDVKLDATGVPYAIYRTSSNSIGIKKYDGTNWVAVTSPSGTTSYKPSVDISGTTLFNLFNGNLRSYNGSSWQNLGSLPGSVPIADMVAKPSNIVYALFPDADNSNLATLYKYDGGWNQLSDGSSYDGVHFSDGSITVDQTRIKVVADGNGNVYMCFLDEAWGEYKVVKYEEASGTSSSIGSFSYYYYNVGLQLDAAGNVYFCYADGNNNNIAGVKKYDGSAWTDLGTTFTGANAAPALAISSSGTPYVAYIDASNANKATVKKFNGTSWVLVGSAGLTGGVVLDNLSLVIDASDKLYMSYIRNQNANLYVKSFGTSPNDANLASLSLSSGSLTPALSSGVTAYTVSVNNNVSSITVTPTTSNAAATVQVRVNSGSYATVANGVPSSALSLNVGSNAVDIKVTAQDGTTIKVYTITVTREVASNNADLSSLTTNSGSAISPTFAAGTVAYTASVANVTSSITVTPTAAQGNATIEVRVNSGSYTTVASGAASSALALIVGSNTVDIKVTAQDGTTIKTYTITVTRVAAGGNAPNALHFDGIDDYVNIPTSVTDLNKADFTIEAWIKTTQVGGGIVACSNGNTSWDTGEKVFYLNSSGKPTFVGWGNEFINSSQAVNDGTWHHVAVVWDYSGSGTSGTPKMYIDGIDKTATSNYTANYNNLGTFKLGMPNYLEAPNFFNGSMDDIRIWSVARTQSQIQANMSIELAGNESGLQAYYKLNNGIAGGINTGVITATDIAGNGGNGTLNNFALTTGNTSNWVAGTIAVTSSTDATLSALTTTAGTITPTFASATVAYTANVTNVTSSVTVTPTVNQANATVQVRVNNGSYATVASGLPSSALLLNVGSNTIDVLVTAQDGTTTKTYTITVTRAFASTDATLSALITTAGTLTPTFASATIAYAASVSNATSSVTVTPTRNEANATIQVQVNSGGYSTVTSGSPSSALALNVGANPIDIKVTAEDGSTIKTYTITVTRAAPPVPPTITSFTPTSGVAGTSVTISGTNFSTTAANNIVYFGATKATVVGTPTATSITVTVPAGATYAPISLLNTTSVFSCTSNARFTPVFSPSKTTISTSDLLAPVTTTLSNPAFMYQVANGDLDGDGKPDVAFANRNAGVTIMRNASTTGSVSFPSRLELTTTYQEPFVVAMADVDGDGKLDIVSPAGNLNGTGLSVFLNSTTSVGSISFGSSISTAMGTGNLSIGDFDSDGKPDLVITQGDRLGIYRNLSTGVGNFSIASAVYTANGTMNNYVSSLHTVADIDGDGKLDIISGNGTNMTVFLNTSSGSGNISFAAVANFATTSNVAKVAVGDFNGDGKIDIATIANYSAANTKMSVFQNNSTSGNLSFTRTEYDSYDPSEIMVGDFNGDGKTDIAITSLTFTTFNTALGVYQNKSTGSTVSFGSRVAFGPVNEISCYYATSFDIDGDGKPDVLTSNPSSYSVFRNLSTVNAWTGTTSTAWATATNWSAGSVPTSTDEASIPSGTANAPTITNAQSIADISIASGATLTANNTLNVSGTINNNGTVAGSGTVNLNGSSAQIITGTGTIANLTLNNSTGATISSGMTSLSGILTLTLGTLTTGGFLTLKSDATGTARIAAITSGSISGNITQERYIPAKSSRTWSMVASPFIQTISNAWQQQVHITGAGTGGTVCPSLTSNSNGFDATVTNAASMFVYDGTKAVGSRWSSIASTTGTSLSAGTGYRMNIRGPRSTGCSLLDGTVSTTAAVTLSSTGTLSNANKNMGSFTTTVSNNGDASGSNDNYLLIGNPYPSQISFSALRTANSSVIANSYATYAPGNTVGNYAFWNGATWSGGNTGLSNGTGDIIASGQAFFVKGSVAGANISLSWTESMKSTSAQAGYFRTNQLNPNRLRIGYFLTNGNKADEVMVEFAEKASSTEINDGDVVSINSGSQNLKSIKAGKELVFNTRNINFSMDTVMLNVASSSNGTFRLSFYDFDEFIANTNAKVYLVDRYTGTTQLMNDTKDYSFTVNTSDAASIGVARFAVVFSKPAPVVLPVFVDVKAYPNPVMDELKVQLPQGKWALKLTDAAGKVVLQQNASSSIQTISMARLAPGAYLLEASNEKGEKSIQKIVKQ